MLIARNRYRCEQCGNINETGERPGRNEQANQRRTNTMANAPINTGGGGVPLDLQGFANQLATGIAESRASTIIGGREPIMRLGRDGDWIYGQENEPVQEGSQWIINIRTLAHGWQCWAGGNDGRDGKPKAKNSLKGEKLDPMTVPKPPRPAPIDGTEWSELRAFQLKCCYGDDEGVQVIYKTNSDGGMRAVDALLVEILKQLRIDPAHAFPIVTLESDSYNHPSWGKIYKPILSIVGWADTNLNFADNAGDGDGDDDGDGVAEGDYIDGDGEVIDESDLAVDDGNGDDPPAEPEPAPTTRRRAAAAPPPQTQARKQPLPPRTAAAAAPKPGAKPATATAPKAGAKPAAPAPTGAAHTGQRRRPGAGH